MNIVIKKCMNNKHNKLTNVKSMKRFIADLDQCLVTGAILQH